MKMLVSSVQPNDATLDCYESFCLKEKHQRRLLNI